jgi:type II secretory pathway component GspD/PulD (secretin)
MNHTRGMKTKFIIWLAAGLWASLVSAQTPSSAPAEAGAPPATNNVPAANPAPPSPPLVVEAPTNAAPVVTVVPGGATTNAPSAISPDEAERAELMDAVFEDAPLFEVIRTLARQANINIIFDPKVISGTVGPDGKPVPEPVVSLRLKNVTAPAVLDTLLNNYNYSLIPDPKTKIARIIIKDPKAPEPLITKVVALQYCSPTNMAMLIKSVFTTRTQAIPDPRTSQLVVMATAKDWEAIDELVKELDEPTKQVLIEARLLETSQSPESVKGIDWSGTLEAQRVSFGNGQSAVSATTAIPGSPVTTTLPSGRTITTTPSMSSSTVLNTIGGAASSSGSAGGSASQLGGFSLNTARGITPNIAFLSADGASAVLSFLNKNADTEVVANPRAVTLDNETAVLSVTRAYPIFQITPGSANSPAGSQVQYTNLGTILRVTPRISGSNNIALKVVPEVSNIDSKDQQTINGQLNVANIYAIRKVETTVVIPSGHTLVMGGLITDNITKSFVKVPILGDLPGIGLAFRQDSKKRVKQNLLIFITPSIIQDADFQTRPPSKFLQEEGRDNTDRPVSAWDSGTPFDWNSKKK